MGQIQPLKSNTEPQSEFEVLNQLAVEIDYGREDLKEKIDNILDDFKDIISIVRLKRNVNERINFILQKEKIILKKSETIDFTTFNDQSDNQQDLKRPENIVFNGLNKFIQSSEDYLFLNWFEKRLNTSLYTLNNTMDLNLDLQKLGVTESEVSNQESNLKQNTIIEFDSKILELQNRLENLKAPLVEKEYDKSIIAMGYGGIEIRRCNQTDLKSHVSIPTPATDSSISEGMPSPKTTCDSNIEVSPNIPTEVEDDKSKIA